MAEREYDLDRLRVVGAFAVVWLHVSGYVLTDTSRGLDGAWWVGNLANAMSRWCVPAFVMVSGALLLARPVEEKPVPYYRRRLLRLLAPIAVWTPFYALIVALSPHGVVDVRASLLGVLRGQPVEGFHLWYLYMCVGLYLLAPFLRYFLDAVPRPWRVPAMAVGFAAASIESIVRQAEGSAAGGTFLGLCLPFVPYFVAGRLLRDCPPGMLPARSLLSVAAVCGTAVAGATAALYPFLGLRSWVIVNGYLSPLVIAMSLCIYAAATRRPAEDRPPSGRSARLVRGLAPLTLGIYVLHPFCLLLLARCGIRPHAPHPLIGVPLVTVLAFLLAAGMARAIACVPVLRRTVT